MGRYDDSDEGYYEDEGEFIEEKPRWSQRVVAVFTGSYGVSILAVNTLDKVEFFGFPLGFWFSQQGSILVFLVLILVYIRMMNALDEEYSDEAQQDQASVSNSGEELS